MAKRGNVGQKTQVLMNGVCDECGAKDNGPYQKVRKFGPTGRGKMVAYCKDHARHVG